MYKYIISICVSVYLSVYRDDLLEWFTDCGPAIASMCV